MEDSKVFPICLKLGLLKIKPSKFSNFEDTKKQPTNCLRHHGASYHVVRASLMKKVSSPEKLKKKSFQ